LVFIVVINVTLNPLSHAVIFRKYTLLSFKPHSTTIFSKHFIVYCELWLLIAFVGYIESLVFRPIKQFRRDQVLNSKVTASPQQNRPANTGLNFHMSNTIYWFRKALRLHDNPALVNAIEGAKTFHPIFCLDPWFVKSGRVGINRMRFLFESLIDLDQSLRKIGSQLIILQGDPLEEIPRLKFITLLVQLCLLSTSISSIFSPSEYAVFGMYLALPSSQTLVMSKT
jgi:DNA photolyase